MAKERKYLAIRRDQFYNHDGRSRYHSGLPWMTYHPPDAPMYYSPGSMQGVPIEYFIIPVTSLSEWDGTPYNMELIKETEKATRKNLSLGAQFTTMELPQLSRNPDTDHVSVLQVNAQNYAMIKKHAGEQLIEVDSLDRLFREFNYHLPDAPATIDVPERVKEMLSQVPEGPLNGVLVVAFDQQIAGALAAEELARAGATVIKVEKLDEGDPKRRNSSATSFGTFNAGKFSVTFDDSADSQKLKKDLLGLADVVVDNRSTAAQERDTILQEELRTQTRVKPLIFASISGFGRDSGRTAYDRVVQAESGMAALNGRVIPFPLVDMATGKEAASEIVKSLFLRERMSPKQKAHTPTMRLDISMVAVALNLMANQVTTFIDTGKPKSTIVPFDLYETKDGRVSVAIAKDNQFLKLAELIEAPQLLQFDTNDKRIANREEVEEGIKAALGKRTTDEWLKILGAHNIPVGPVLELEQALANHGDKVLKVTKQGTLFVGSPTTSNLYPINPVINDAPSHGQHTADVAGLTEHLRNNASPRALQDSIEVSSVGPNKHFQREYEFVDAHDIDFSKNASEASWAKGEFFAIRKIGKVTAVPAKPYEVVDVIHTDAETGVSAVSKRVAMAGDWKITTAFGDTYVLPEAQFNKNYVPVEGEDNVFKPNPELKPRKAIEITKNVRFMSPSNDVSYIPAGGWLVEGTSGAYGIHPNNIEGNYKVAKWTSAEVERGERKWAVE